MSSQHDPASESSALKRLSRRERQVLTFIVEGKTTTEIAALVHISPKTVETYHSRIMAKLEIEDLPSLVKFAIRNKVTTL